MFTYEMKPLFKNELVKKQKLSKEPMPKSQFVSVFFTQHFTWQIKYGP